ncbi:hypothetical protein GCM10008090_17000 [Arenicella chitinivorans]|uniref:DsrE family protein n=1 Tax=Arenicella chitinivorans TaxID=1329800 RepID=A0A918RPC3_9GAMM|nr:DsrE family protein [Arenicella chitinivorans]GHA07776.1 hypothetical protein GCM10008090_17000 [Arenicella chitinivorans]
MRYMSLICVFLLGLNGASASDPSFSKGPVFLNYGSTITIEGGLATPQEEHFKVVFDVAKSAENNVVNRQFDSIARFINMHVRAGVPREHIAVALVVHGKASFDVLQSDAYQAKFDHNNASAELVSELLANDVAIFLCGQSASYLGIDRTQLIDGVQMSLSAMTANALLQQQGYTLNPF